MWDREKGRERAEHALWMKMLIRNYDKYYLFWSIPLVTLFIWFDSLITQLMRLMMRCEKNALFAKLNTFNYRFSTFTSFALNWLTTPEMFVWTVMIKLRDFRTDS